MISIDINSKKIRRFHTIAANCSAICWWLAILMMIVHLYFCFEPWKWTADTIFPHALFKNESIIRSLICLRWVLQILIYFLFGRAILKKDEKQLIVLPTCAIILPIIRGFLLGFSWVNYMWDIICWVIILEWMICIKRLNESDNSLKSKLCLIVFGIVFIFFRSYYTDAEYITVSDYIAFFSFIIQDMIRSIAMIFFGIWLLTTRKKPVG